MKHYRKLIVIVKCTQSVYNELNYAIKTGFETGLPESDASGPTAQLLSSDAAWDWTGW